MQKYINQKLQLVSVEVKCKKSNYNSFGKYSYWNIEDICEAIKPLQEKHNVVFTLDDEIINIGDRFYVKAKASVTCTESGESISVVGYAREPESIKQMNPMQIVGACSSYARKRAMSGLLMLDDTKDADSFNKHEDEPSNINNENGDDDLL